MVSADDINNRAQSFPVYSNGGGSVSWNHGNGLSLRCKNHGTPGVLIKLLKLIDIFLQHGKMYTKLDCIQ